MKQQGKIHYAWFILAGCFALYGGTMGAGYNCGGVFNAAISGAMGWKISEFTFSMVFLGTASALALIFVDRIFKRFNLKVVLGISIVLYALTLALKCFCNELWQFYLLYAVNGAASSFLFYVPVPMLLNNWFKKKQGFALGLAVLSSGIMGAIMNPIYSSIIEACGWRCAAVVNGLVVLAFSLPLTLLLLRKTPQEMGLLPYGEEDRPEEPMRVAISPSQVDEWEYYNPVFGREEKKQLFAFSFLLAIIVLVVSMIPQQLAHFAQVNGMGAVLGASLVSAGMIGNMTSKTVMGACVDRYGKEKTFTVSFLLVAVGFLTYALVPGAPLVILYAAAFLTGITAANNVVVMPFMVGIYSSGEEYTYYMSKVSIATMIGTACGTFVCSAIYDLAGTYTVEFLLFIALDLLGLYLVRRILSAEKKGKNHG